VTAATRSGDLLHSVGGGEELAHIATEPEWERRGRRRSRLTSNRWRARRSRDAASTALYAPVEAYAVARGGGNVIVTIGTASWTTLAFNLPVFDTLAADRLGRPLPLPDEMSGGPARAPELGGGRAFWHATAAALRAASGVRLATDIRDR
jgi:hypothetical protein